jgi:hypothetical protein
MMNIILAVISMLLRNNLDSLFSSPLSSLFHRLVGGSFQLPMWCGHKAKLRAQRFSQSMPDSNGNAAMGGEKKALIRMKLVPCSA